MKIRFGYVSHALSLWECSPAKTMTFTRWKQLNQQEREEKLYTITKENLRNTLRILHYNIAHEIHLYRFSSSMVPLATHPEVNFDYVNLFRNEFKEIGNLAQQYKLRVSFHPNQFTLFTSDKPHITDNAVVDMEYHYNVLNAMGIADKSFINIHVGGAYGDKNAAIRRFHDNLRKLPVHIKKQMTLENDDKTYTTEETLSVCKHEHIPLVFDYHHHYANPSEAHLEELLPLVFQTWEHTNLNPKVHLSSPKNEKEFRSHAEFVNAEFVKPFFQIAKSTQRDFDVMIESKRKDQALFQLIEDLSKMRGFKRIAGAEIEIK
ncbi:UV DNA damage repair endonuclease UvsE [Bacillus sp. 165]|uniref:UV DNA damage repair endonuclease UvsE n=1 Tax=Bacillus sp. 165 TaxID=1529117 RepID=UPI001ADBE4D4|nr:UV DNA damage repair endonuclease UvsE [Bacillus sp. 165]MBO9130114.1 UV DNA damage repair endonuclease UvsE [Bacillus sp. 165]